jgi:hypothetical protein
VQNCPAAEFIVKVDEDQFVNVPRLLLKLGQYLGQVNILFGNLNINSSVIHGASGKWGVPDEFFPFRSFPPYASGPIYAVTSDLARKISQTASHVFPIHLEDVYITGVVPKVLETEKRTKIHRVALGSYETQINFENVQAACVMMQFEMVAAKVMNETSKLKIWRDFVHANRSASNSCVAELERMKTLNWGIFNYTPL